MAMFRPHKFSPGASRHLWGAIALTLALATGCHSAPDTLTDSAHPETPETVSPEAVSPETASPELVAPAPSAERDLPTTEAETAKPAPPSPQTPSLHPSQSAVASDRPAASPASCQEPLTQREMTECAADTYRQTQGFHRDFLEGRLPNLPAPQQAQLRTAETYWSAFRDGHCDLAASRVAGGTLEPMVRLDCLNETTHDRIAALATPYGADSYATADAALNRTYQALKSHLNPEQQDQLVEVQLAWLDYRDAACEIAPDQESCLAYLTEARTYRLEGQKQQWKL
jgi:uncharacterized protein YecT (DUF1311 family)